LLVQFKQLVLLLQELKMEQQMLVLQLLGQLVLMLRLLQQVMG